MNDWKKLAARTARELESLRKQNDEPMPEEETAILRGRIRQCKWFLALPALMQAEAKDAKKSTNSDEDEDDN